MNKQVAKFIIITFLRNARKLLVYIKNERDRQMNRQQGKGERERERERIDKLKSFFFRQNELNIQKQFNLRVSLKKRIENK